MTTFVLAALLFLAVKHFLFDALLQSPYQYLNKGDIRHPGGYIHAIGHTVGSYLALQLACIISGDLSHGENALIMVSVLDGVLHYAIDYTKVNLGKNTRWSSGGKDEDGRACLRIYNDKYFYALIADQCLHFATYVFIVWIVS